jgi:hypothetical protein
VECLGLGWWHLDLHGNSDSQIASFLTLTNTPPLFWREQASGLHLMKIQRLPDHPTRELVGDDFPDTEGTMASDSIGLRAANLDLMARTKITW